MPMITILWAVSSAASREYQEHF